MDMQDQFHDEMLILYRDAAQVITPPTRFLQMVDSQGGVATARQLLAATDISDGFSRLWEAGRLDLTVEAVVLRDRWRPLFTPGELEIARRRLADVGYGE